MVGYIRDIFISKKVTELSHYEPLTIGPKNNVADAANLMKLNSISSILVTDEMGLLVGILSERDIVRKVIANREVLEDILISDVMTKEVSVIKDNASIGRAIYYMQIENVRHLPIVQNKSNPLGVVSAKDIVDFLAKVLDKTNERFNHVKNSEVTEFLKSEISSLNLKKVIKVKKNLPIKKALNLFIENNIGSLIVVDDEKNAIGILTEKDFIIKIEDEKCVFDIKEVSEIMTEFPVCIRFDESVETALQLLSSKKARHLPVLDRDSKAYAMLSVRDMLSHIGEGIVSDL